MMKIIFFGTPDYVLPVLTTLHKRFVSGPGKSPVVAVVTQSPKPTGRKQYLTYSSVDKWAHERKVFTHYSANELIDANLDMEVGILASYGEIIKKEVIDLFPQGILVIHPSLLPKYRGASPIQAAIANGDTQTGVTIFKMDEKVDHGPIISQFKEDILPNDTFETLRTRLFEKSAEVLAEMIEPYLKGKITPKIQDETDATYTKIVKREDGFVDLKKDSPEKIERLSRAMYPWPGIWTNVVISDKQKESKRLKLLKVHIERDLVTSLLSLVPDIVQLEGKNPVSWKQFEEAYKVEL